MNTNEARVVIVEEIAEILFDLSEDEDQTASDKMVLKEAMLDAADIIAEALDLQVLDFADGFATVRLNLAGPDPALS